MGIADTIFYDLKRIGLIPMGLCYPGRGKFGDNPPTKECASAWHKKLFNQMERPQLTLLIGSMLRTIISKKNVKRTLIETVRDFKTYLPNYFVLPHPSPRNNIWQAKNEWFKEEVLPSLKLKYRIFWTK